MVGEDSVTNNGAGLSVKALDIVATHLSALHDDQRIGNGELQTSGIVGVINTKQTVEALMPEPLTCGEVISKDRATRRTGTELGKV